MRGETGVIETQVQTDVRNAIALSRVADFDVYVNFEEGPADLGKDRIVISRRKAVIIELRYSDG